MNKRSIPILLALLFLAPVAVSFYLYYGAGAGQSRGKVNHGELISPAIPVDASFLRGKWSLVYVGPGACDAPCRRALHDMRQVRLSLNQDMERVQRVFLYTGACCEQPFFSDEQAGLIAHPLPEGFPAETGHLYLTDPLGNLLMRYTPQMEAKGMREDLKRLLKLSHIG